MGSKSMTRGNNPFGRKHLDPLITHGLYWPTPIVFEKDVLVSPRSDSHFLVIPRSKNDTYLCKPRLFILMTKQVLRNAGTPA